MLPDMAPRAQSSQLRSDQERLRERQVYRCRIVYRGCPRSYKPMVPGIVLPCALAIVYASALRRFFLQNSRVQTNSSSPSRFRKVMFSASNETHSNNMLLWIPCLLCAMHAMWRVPGQ